MMQGSQVGQERCRYSNVGERKREREREKCYFQRQDEATQSAGTRERYLGLVYQRNVSLTKQNKTKQKQKKMRNFLVPI
jgi:hypothetical protein